MKIEHVLSEINFAAGYCDEAHSPDLYANSHTWFAFGMINETGISTDNGDASKYDLLEFQRNVRASSLLRCHTNIWKIGISTKEDSFKNDLHKWLDALVETSNLEIGVFPLAQYRGWKNSVWRMEVEVHYKANSTSLTHGNQTDWCSQYWGSDAVLQRSSRHLSTSRIIETEEAMEMTSQDELDREAWQHDVRVQFDDGCTRTEAMSEYGMNVRAAQESTDVTSRGHPHRFSKTGLRQFNQYTPHLPYLTFSIGHGVLSQLVVKIWSHDQGNHFIHLSLSPK